MANKNNNENSKCVHKCPDSLNCPEWEVSNSSNCTVYLVTLLLMK